MPSTHSGFSYENRKKRVYEYIYAQRVIYLYIHTYIYTLRSLQLFLRKQVHTNVIHIPDKRFIGRLLVEVYGKEDISKAERVKPMEIQRVIRQVRCVQDRQDGRCSYFETKMTGVISGSCGENVALSTFSFMKSITFLQWENWNISSVLFTRSSQNNVTLFHSVENGDLLYW